MRLVVLALLVAGGLAFVERRVVAAAPLPAHLERGALGAYDPADAGPTLCSRGAP